MATKSKRTENTNTEPAAFRYSDHVLVENKSRANHTVSLPSSVQTDKEGNPVLTRNPATGKDVPMFTPARSFDLIPGISPVRVRMFEQTGEIEGITKKACVGSVFELVADSADLAALEAEGTDREALIDCVSRTNHLGLLEAWQDDTRIKSGQVRAALTQKILLLKNPEEFLRQHPDQKSAIINLAIM